MVKKKIYFILLVIIILPFVQGLALHGNHLSPIIFEPGKKIMNHYVIDDTDKKVIISLGGELLEYVRVTEVVNNEFDLIIEVPETLPEPGEYWFSLHATEVGGAEGSGVGSLVSVNLRFQVEVPPHGKAISLSFDIPDLNEHMSIPIAVNVENKGLENIARVGGSVSIYDLKNSSIAFVSLEEKPLSALSSTSLFATIPADKLSAGKYWAEAVVNYDSKEKRARDEFKIGNLDLLFINYSASLERGFDNFWVIVENNWGNPLQRVDAIISINGTELLTTPTITLGPWQRDTLKGIIKTDFAPGRLNGTIQLSYDDFSKTENVTFTIVEPAADVQKISAVTIFIITGIIVLLIAGAFIGYIFIKRRTH